MTSEVDSLSYGVADVDEIRRFWDRKHLLRSGPEGKDYPPCKQTHHWFSEVGQRAKTIHHASRPIIGLLLHGRMIKYIIHHGMP